ncbi:hypothetical protein [Jeotgalibacillus proteolyticus]|uniref:hypothetical protein n=1 Tax=Jeotgalibacillus proteolyticus TaxID=2082395 RepID=UPI003CEAD9C4
MGERHITYTAKPQKWAFALIFFFAVLPLPYMMQNQAGPVLWIYIVVLSGILLLGFLRFEIKVETGALHYSIQLFSKSIYQLSLPPEKIKRMLFCRFGWTSKGVVIGLQKGFSIRLVRFSDAGIQAVYIFACEHELSVHKTDEYLSLEKSTAASKERHEKGRKL